MTTSLRSAAPRAAVTDGARPAMPAMLATLATFATFAILALLACGGGKGAATTPAGDSGAASDDPVAELVRLKDQLCACDTRSCADAVGAKLNALSQRYAGAKLTDAQADQAQAAGAEIDRCAARIEGAPEDERRSPSDN
jgi:hypothetical protein